MSCRFFEIGAPAVIAFGLALLPAARASSGKLEDVKDATADDSGDQGDDDDGDDDDGDDDAAGDAIAEAVFAAIGHAIADAAQERAARVRFRRYPYADGAAGWVVRAGAAAQDGAAEPEEAAALPSASFRFSLDYAYDWDKVHRPAAALALDTSAGVGLRADLTNYVERLPGGALDDLVIGTLIAMFRVADASRVAPYVGLGWRYLAAVDAFRNGFNCLLAADVFPLRPLVVSAIVEGGNLGRAGFFHGRATLGALVQKLELFAGYDAVVIGDDRVPVVFHGPVAGIRGWL